MPSSNPIRSRINAAFFALLDSYMHWKYRRLKERLFADLPDAIVEVGAGTGANFRYLPRGTRVVAVEPNVHMHGRLERSARRHGLVLDIRDAGAERIDVEDESVDAVVCSLVLCTVDDPEKVLAEVRRILRPGGRFICIEHVGAKPGTFLRRLQHFVFRPWRWFFEGCHTHRDTARTLQHAGFRRVSIEAFTLPSIFVPVRAQIAAVCVK